MDYQFSCIVALSLSRTRKKRLAGPQIFTESIGATSIFRGGTLIYVVNIRNQKEGFDYLIFQWHMSFPQLTRWPQIGWSFWIKMHVHGALTAVLPSKADNVPNSDVEDSHPIPSHPTSTQTAGTPCCEVSFQLKKQKLPSPVVWRTIKIVHRWGSIWLSWY